MTVQYGSGSRAYQVSLDSYAMMVARSTTREAGNLGRINQLVENGHDLVKITEHYPTCSICAPFQNRVFSISGKDKRFPPLSMAFKNGYNNIHPNCRHTVIPWIESLHTKEEIAEAIHTSNQPFTDMRSTGERSLYSAQQTQNRQVRQDLYQYERYKARLGADAPKTFSAFRRTKKNGGASWGILESQYKGMGYYEKALKREPGITKTVINVAENIGMTPAGIEYRIKNKDSFLRKIRSNYSPTGTEYEVKDILRYTYVSGKQNLADKTLKSIEVFAQKGYTTTEIKNYWLNAMTPYKGVNTILRDAFGQPFELQYHTPESFALKNGELHTLYEEWRVLPYSDPKRAEFERRMEQLTSSLITPEGIEKVK